MVPQYFQLIFGKLVHVAKHLHSINLGRILIFSNKVIDLYQFKFKGDVPPPFLKDFWNDRKLQSVKSLLMTWNHLGWKKTFFCEKFVHFATNRNLSKKYQLFMNFPGSCIPLIVMHSKQNCGIWLICYLFSILPHWLKKLISCYQN